jgi:two-component system response regulator
MSDQKLQAHDQSQTLIQVPMGLRQPLLVFHVNDNTDDQVLFQAACKQADVPFQWHVAESAERGISYLQSLLTLSQTQSVRWPDLVVLDVVMPGASGLTVLEHIRCTPRLGPLPVVILTGHPSAAVQEAAFKLGANSFYEKPSNFTELVNLVRALYQIWSTAQRPSL